MDFAPTCKIIDDGTAVALQFDRGDLARYHAVWLRDNADDPGVRDPDSGQRLHSIGDIAKGITIRQATCVSERLNLTFSDNAQTSASLEYLRRNRYDRHGVGASRAVLELPDQEPWCSDLDLQRITGGYEEVVSDLQAKQRWLHAIARFGFARLTDVPIHDGAVTEVAGLFGFVRETNYGRLFEVRAKPNAENLAFTSLGLDPHTDNPYRDPAPTMQLLHCLENDVTGGESIVVDGFAAVARLRQEHPEQVDLLSRYPVPFTYSGDGISDLRAERPVIEVDLDHNVLGIRINNRSMAAPTRIPFDHVAGFYDAYANLVEITRRADMQIEFRQQPGDLFVVDNTRVLHGRRPFTADGRRWLQGAYADLDGLHSTLRMLSRNNPDQAIP